MARGSQTQLRFTRRPPLVKFGAVVAKPVEATSNEVKLVTKTTQIARQIHLTKLDDPGTVGDAATPVGGNVAIGETNATWDVVIDDGIPRVVVEVPTAVLSTVDTPLDTPEDVAGDAAAVADDTADDGLGFALFPHPSAVSATSGP
jgi:hypothetical protein